MSTWLFLMFISPQNKHAQGIPSQPRNLCSEHSRGDGFVWTRCGERFSLFHWDC
jgi:hypothetical protein